MPSQATPIPIPICWKLFDNSLEAICSLWFVFQNFLKSYSKSLRFFFARFHFSRLPTCMQKQKISLKIECCEKGLVQIVVFFQSPFAPNLAYLPHSFFPTFSRRFLPVFAPQSSPNRAQSIGFTPLHPQNTSQGKKFTLLTLYHPNLLILTSNLAHLHHPNPNQVDLSKRHSRPSTNSSFSLE